MKGHLVMLLLGNGGHGIAWIDKFVEVHCSCLTDEVWDDMPDYCRHSDSVFCDSVHLVTVYILQWCAGVSYEWRSHV